MPNKTESIGIRCTKKQRDEIAARAEECQMKVSEYILRKALWLSPETNLLLENLRYEVHKIGVNINQIARACNSSSHVLSYDYSKALDELEKIDQHFCDVYKELQKQNELQFQMDQHFEDVGLKGDVDEKNSDQNDSNTEFKFW